MSKHNMLLLKVSIYHKLRLLHILVRVVFGEIVLKILDRLLVNITHACLHIYAYPCKNTAILSKNNCQSPKFIPHQYFVLYSSYVCT